MGSKYRPEDSDEFKDEDFNELATRADEKVKKAAWKIKHRLDRAVERKRRQAETQKIARNHFRDKQQWKRS